jgi:hypothetical protein
VRTKGRTLQQEPEPFTGSVVQIARPVLFIQCRSSDCNACTVQRTASPYLAGVLMGAGLVPSRTECEVLARL